jgi:hypothetical protein
MYKGFDGMIKLINLLSNKDASEKIVYTYPILDMRSRRTHINSAPRTARKIIEKQETSHKPTTGGTNNNHIILEKIR